jgi:hypothetical protein
MLAEEEENQTWNGRHPGRGFGEPRGMPQEVQARPSTVLVIRIRALQPLSDNHTLSKNLPHISHCTEYSTYGLTYLVGTEALNQHPAASPATSLLTRAAAWADFRRLPQLS